MNTLTRQSSTSMDTPAYVNSAPLDGSWGQLPASYYTFTVVNNVMRGQLIPGPYHVSSSHDIPAHEGQIRLEVLRAIDFILLEGAEVWQELAKH